MKLNTAAFAQMLGDNKYVFISRLDAKGIVSCPNMVGSSHIHVGECDPMKADNDSSDIEWHLDHCIIKCDKFPVFKEV